MLYQAIVYTSNPKPSHGLFTPQPSRARSLKTKESCTYLIVAALIRHDADYRVVKPYEEVEASKKRSSKANDV